MNDGDLFSKTVMVMVLWAVVFMQLGAAQPPPGPWYNWNYCGKDVKCTNPKNTHTVCARKHNCSPHWSCGEYTDDPFRDLMLDLHNEMRNNVALGKHPNEQVRPSKNMRALSWDYSLEYTGRCHLNRCTGELHDKCRSTRRWLNIGQNTCYYSGWRYFEPFDSNVIRVARYCFNNIWSRPGNDKEVNYKSLLSNFKSNTKGGAVDSFTIMIAAITTHVGCHFSRDLITKDHPAISATARGQFSYIVCNYGIGGNIEDRPVYRLGEPCSGCLSDIKCNEKFRGLCGEIKYARDLAEHPDGGSSVALYIWITVAVVLGVALIVVGGVLIYKFVIKKG